MNFYDTLDEYPFEGTGEAFTPYAGKSEGGEWLEGTISIDFLNANFDQYTTATQMKAATESEGLQLYFDYLVQQNKLPA